MLLLSRRATAKKTSLPIRTMNHHCGAIPVSDEEVQRGQDGRVTCCPWSSDRWLRYLQQRRLHNMYPRACYPKVQETSEAWLAALVLC
jgi:hypothetical protein